MCARAELFRSLRLKRASLPTGIIVIDFSAVFDCAEATDNFSKFKRYLFQAVEIAVWVRAHDECNLRFGESDFSCRFHRCKIQSADNSLVHCATIVITA